MVCLVVVHEMKKACVCHFWSPCCSEIIIQEVKHRNGDMLGKKFIFITLCLPGSLLHVPHPTKAKTSIIARLTSIYCGTQGGKLAVFSQKYNQNYHTPQKKLLQSLPC